MSTSQKATSAAPFFKDLRIHRGQAGTLPAVPGRPDVVLGIDTVSAQAPKCPAVRQMLGPILGDLEAGPALCQG